MPDQNPASVARRIAETLLSREGTGPAWGVTIEAADAGYSKLSMTVRPDMLNGHQTMHGGMIFALADTAFAYACNSRNVATVAQGANIHFIDSVKAGERLVAEARECVVKGRTGSYAVTVFGGDGRVVAEFQGLSRAVGGAVLENL